MLRLFCKVITTSTVVWWYCNLPARHWSSMHMTSVRTSPCFSCVHIEKAPHRQSSRIPFNIQGLIMSFSCSTHLASSEVKLRCASWSSPCGTWWRSWLRSWKLLQCLRILPGLFSAQLIPQRTSKHSKDAWHYLVEMYLEHVSRLNSSWITLSFERLIRETHAVMLIELKPS